MPDLRFEDETLRFATDANLQPLVSKKSIPGRGRGLVASGKGFDTPRETAVWIRTPFLVTLDSPRLQERCYQCLRRQHDDALHGPVSSGSGGGDDGDSDDQVALKACLGCHAVKYCSKSCQSRSWREGHKFECKIFGGLYPRILPSIVRAVVRILKLRSNGHIEERRWQDFLSLESHEQDLLNIAGVAGAGAGDGGVERCQDIYLMSKAAHKYSGTKEPLELVLRICCILTVNCLTLTDAVLEPLGIALDPVAAMLNHSCEPNCAIRFDAADMLLLDTAATITDSSKSRSTPTPILGSIAIDILRPIREGDELTISYIDNTQPRARRQADLAARYFFACTCSRCSRGSKTPFDRILVSAESAEAREAQAYATEVLDASLSQERDLSSLIPAMNSALSRLAQSRTFPIHRYPGAQLRLQLVLALIEAGRWRDATLQSAILVYRIDPVLYPEQQQHHHHPIRVVNKWRLYRLAQHLLHLLSSLLPPSHSAAATGNSNQVFLLGKAEKDEEKLLQMTLVVTIYSLQFPPRPRPPRSSLDRQLAQALAELQQQAHAYSTFALSSGSNNNNNNNSSSSNDNNNRQGYYPTLSSSEGSHNNNKRLFNAAALLTDHERDRAGMEERLAKMWNEVIDAALNSSEQAGNCSSDAIKLP